MHSENDDDDDDEDRTGQSKTVTQSDNISPIWGEAPLYRLKPKFAWWIVFLT